MTAFTLEPASTKDISILSKIGHKPFENERDQHTRLKSNPRYGSYDHGATMAGVLATWLSRPAERCQVIKAVDENAGEILGYIAWGFRGYDQPTEPREKVQGATWERRDQSTPNRSTQADAAKSENEKTGVARLQEITSADLQLWMEQVMPHGTRCMFVISLVVATKYRRKGVGSALIEYGTSRADRDGVFCWVHSSDGGKGVFEKHGFEVVRTLEVDLDRYAREEDTLRQGSEEQGADQNARPEERYGVYTFSYMKRFPQKRNEGG